jgi:hypothetical protein
MSWIDRMMYELMQGAHQGIADNIKAGAEEWLSGGSSGGKKSSNTGNKKVDGDCPNWDGRSASNSYNSIQEAVGSTFDEAMKNAGTMSGARYVPGGGASSNQAKQDQGFFVNYVDAHPWNPFKNNMTYRNSDVSTSVVTNGSGSKFGTESNFNAVAVVFALTKHHNFNEDKYFRNRARNEKRPFYVAFPRTQDIKLFKKDGSKPVNCPLANRN